MFHGNPVPFWAALILSVLFAQGCASFDPGERTASYSLTPPAHTPLTDAGQAALKDRESDAQSGFYLLDDGHRIFGTGIVAGKDYVGTKVCGYLPHLRALGGISIATTTYYRY